MSKEKAKDLSIDINEIMQLLPHRYPFLLVDRVLDYEEWKWLKAIKNISINEPCFTGHFPHYPIFPGVLILEALAQATGILVFKTMSLPKDELYFLASIENAKFKKPVLPGDQLLLEVEHLRTRSKMSKLRGVASVDGKIICETILTCAQAKAS